MQTAFRNLSWLVVASLLVTGCFDEPVSEKVTVEVRSDRSIDIRTVVDIRSSSENAAVMQRLEGLRSSFASGTDAWTRRYEAINPAEETFSWQKKDGQLAHIERRARIDDLRLPYFFADTSVTVTMTRGADGGELAIYPGRSRRATDSQSRELEGAIGRWSLSLESYFRAVDALYRYLEANPDRSWPLIAPFFADALTQEERDSLIEPAGEELVLVQNVSDALYSVAEVLGVDDERPLTLDELSRVVYDPFPSDLTIIVPGELAEVSGFERQDANTVFVRRLSLWDALSSLERKWAAPDLLLPWVSLQQGEAVDVPAIVNAARRSSTPSVGDIRRAIESQLAPRDSYRVRWKD